MEALGAMSERSSQCSSWIHFFSILQFLGTHLAHTFRSFKRSCSMLHAKPWEHPSAVVTLCIVILLSARINSSTRCTVASVAVSTVRPGTGIICDFRTSLRKFLDFVVNRFTLSLRTSFAFSTFAYKNAQQNAALRCYITQVRSQFWLLKPASEHEHEHLLSRLSWSWTVLLPSDTHRKPITSVTVVLLPFVISLVYKGGRANVSKLLSIYSTHKRTVGEISNPGPSLKRERQVN
jgi:hypothetical protein